MPSRTPGAIGADRMSGKLKAHQIPRGVLAVLLSPAIHAAAQAVAMANLLLLFPRRVAVTTLYILNSGSGDLLAYLTAQPTSKMQLERQRQALTSVQQRLSSQQRLVEDLQREVDALRSDRRKLQRRNAELSARLDETGAAATQNGGEAPGGANPDSGSGSDDGRITGRRSRAGESGWTLHVAVAVAAAAIRWWLANETDAVQRKIGLVLLWPAAWIYGAMVLGCLPGNSALLRRAFACLSYVTVGYVARCMAERALNNGINGGMGGVGLAHKWAAAAAGATVDWPTAR